MRKIGEKEDFWGDIYRLSDGVTDPISYSLYINNRVHQRNFTKRVDKNKWFIC